MTLVRWDPWREIEDMFDRYNKAVHHPRGQEMAAGDWSPRVDIEETEGAFHIRAEVPGISKEQIKVAVDQGVLSIRGERKQENEDKGKKFHRIERQFGSFVRSFTLPDSVDPGKIEASFADGVLHLDLPKTEPEKPKAIEVAIK